MIHFFSLPLVPDYFCEHCQEELKSIAAATCQRGDKSQLHAQILPKTTYMAINAVLSFYFENVPDTVTDLTRRLDRSFERLILH